jgi:RNA polymerase-binding transcription factor DksA
VSIGRIYEELETERERLERLRTALRDASALDQVEGVVAKEIASVAEDPAEHGSETFERTKDLSIVRELSLRLEEIQRALRRLDRGEYGLCEACGEPIPDERLAAKPSARFCREDQAMAERGI